MNKLIAVTAALLLTACAAQPQSPVAAMTPSRTTTAQASLPGPSAPAPTVIEPAQPVRSGTMLLPAPY